MQRLPRDTCVSFRFPFNLTTIDSRVIFFPLSSPLPRHPTPQTNPSLLSFQFVPTQITCWETVQPFPPFRRGMEPENLWLGCQVCRRRWVEKHFLPEFASCFRSVIIVRSFVAALSLEKNKPAAKVDFLRALAAALGLTESFGRFVSALVCAWGVCVWERGH